MNTYEQADALLDALEKAPVGTPAALFPDELAKQWMESSVIRAIRKLQAADYHCRNIGSEIHKLEKTAHYAAKSFRRKQGKMFGRIETDNIAYELDAFLAATRSCIDFVSRMLARHIKGMNRSTGISGLLNSVKNPNAPFRGLLVKWRGWVEQLKAYRDAYVHYRTIYVSGGYKIEWRGRQKSVTIVPVRVPDEVLPDKPTTRAGRNAMIVVDIHKNIGIEGVPPPQAEGPLSKDAQKLMESVAEFGRDKGYVPVEEFCAKHLEKLHQFVSESFREVHPLKFQSYVK